MHDARQVLPWQVVVHIELSKARAKGGGEGSLADISGRIHAGKQAKGGVAGYLRAGGGGEWGGEEVRQSESRGGHMRGLLPTSVAGFMQANRRKEGWRDT